jgi:hypothetical protein
MAVNVEEIVSINGKEMPLKDVPYPARAMFGYGHPAVYKQEGREVQPGDWPHTPETCQRADEGHGEWINGGTTLVCPGCGLDCT